MVWKYVIHHHKAGKAHFDLRVITQDNVRSFSMLRQPPLNAGEQRLAIERDVMNIDDIRRRVIYEPAFGAGKAYMWDEGEAEVQVDSPQRLLLELRGRKLSGTYELRHMKWYPGNRWLIRKPGTPGKGVKQASQGSRP